MIEHDLTLLIAFILGYYLGRGRNPKKDIDPVFASARKQLAEFHDAGVPVGPIKRPSAQDLAKRNEPPHIKQQKEAMKETLDQIPELVEAKEKLEQANAGSWIP